MGRGTSRDGLEEVWNSTGRRMEWARWERGLSVAETTELVYEHFRGCTGMIQLVQEIPDEIEHASRHAHLLTVVL